MERLAPSVPEGPRILFVDDDKELIFVLRAHLGAVGYVTADASTGEEAVERARSFAPDLIVMDLGLPGIDGIEATRRIKAIPQTADIPVIMLTARSGTDHLVTAFEAGAQEYVVKPFEVAELLARIRTVSRLHQARQELDRLNNSLAHAVEESTSRLRVLYEFSRRLNETESRDGILDLIIETVRKLIGSDRVSILLKDDHGAYLRCARAVGIDPAVRDSIRVRTNEGIAGTVFTTGKTYVASTLADAHAAPGRYHSDAFISTPLIATSLMTNGETLGVLSITDRPGGQQFTEDEISCIRSVADSAAIAIHNHMRRQRLDESVNVLLMTVGRLAEYRDDETGNHLERVREYARILTTELKDESGYDGSITDEFIDNIYRAAPMHDIGKVGIPDEILRKPGRLTEAEFDIMREHCRIGREVLEAALVKTGPLPILTMCVEIASCHHEKFDGSGYPEGLTGQNIPLSARIIALVDAYDAITSQRRYKDAIDHEQAMEMICTDAGTHFDPALIEPFRRCADRFARIRQAYCDLLAEPEPAIA